LSSNNNAANTTTGNENYLTFSSTKKTNTFLSTKFELYSLVHSFKYFDEFLCAYKKGLIPRNPHTGRLLYTFSYTYGQWRISLTNRPTCVPRIEVSLKADSLDVAK
jgi:hypothetical protein